VNVTLDGHRALDDVSWSLNSGEHWAFVGANGSGKSTLLRVIRGQQWIDPDGGERAYGFDGVVRGAMTAGAYIGFVAPEQQERYKRLDLPIDGRSLIGSGFDDTLYLHVMVNRGFPEVIWTELWRSDDSGISWQHMGEQAKFPAALHKGFAQCWSWDYDPDDGWVYVVSTSFKRDKGIILRRVRPADIGDKSKYSGWGFARGRWAWDNEPTPITPPGETLGELSFRRLAKGSWILGGFLSSKYALGYRTIDGPTANMYAAPIQLPVTGSGWDNEDHAASRVAQFYGGYVLPGSRLDVAGGAGLVVSQWKTDSGWPYRAMQFRSSLKDTTRGAGRDPADPINL